MFCIYCGKEIMNSSRFCQYCGKSATPSPAKLIEVKPKQPNAVVAIIGLALSLIGLAIISLILNTGAILGIPACIAAGVLCSLQIKKTYAKPIAITGLSISIVGTLIGICILLFGMASSNFI